MPQTLKDFWSNMGSGVGSALTIASIALALLILFFLYRAILGHRLRVPGGGRARQPRLGLVDAFSVDGQRQLVLVRRDNVEHLIMIGGPNDVLIESQIVRMNAPTAPPPRETVAVAPTLPTPAPVAKPSKAPAQAPPPQPPPPQAQAPQPQAPQPPVPQPPQPAVAEVRPPVAGPPVAPAAPNRPSPAPAPRYEPAAPAAPNRLTGRPVLSPLPRPIVPGGSRPLNPAPAPEPPKPAPPPVAEASPAPAKAPEAPPIARPVLVAAPLAPPAAAPQFHAPFVPPVVTPPPEVIVAPRAKPPEAVQLPPAKKPDPFADLDALEAEMSRLLGRDA